MSYDDYLERQREAHENWIELPPHWAEFELEDPDEGGIWWMRVLCRGDSFANFTLIHAQRDKEPAVKQFAELADLGKRLSTEIEHKLQDCYEHKKEPYFDD